MHMHMHMSHAHAHVHTNPNPNRRPQLDHHRVSQEDEPAGDCRGGVARLRHRSRARRLRLRVGTCPASHGSGTGRLVSRIGACIYESEAFDYLDAPVERVTGADIPMPYASNLEIDALPQINNIITGVQKVCYRL